MKHTCVVGSLLVLAFVSLGELGWAQEENLSAGRSVGIGVRFLPNALMPVAPSDVDHALGAAITGQYWMSDLLAIEAGGWLSSFSDSWNPRSFTSLSGGLLLKLSDNVRDDLYVAARAISVQSVYRSYCCVYREGKLPQEAQKIMPPYPWPIYESRTSTLAFAVTAGIERSWSAQVTTNFEFGFVYAQVMTANLPPPPGEPLPEEPVPVPKPAETMALTSFGITVHISVNFYLPRK